MSGRRLDWSRTSWENRYSVGTPDDAIGGADIKDMDAVLWARARKRGAKRKATASKPASKPKAKTTKSGTHAARLAKRKAERRKEKK